MLRNIHLQFLQDFNFIPIHKEKLRYMVLNVARFIRKYCIRKEGATCPAKDMYIVFCGYVKNMRMQPIKRVYFVRIVRDVYGFRYYRPHHNTKSNPYAFGGIELSFEAVKNLASDSSAKEEECFSNSIEESILLHL